MSDRQLSTSLKPSPVRLVPAHYDRYAARRAVNAFLAYFLSLGQEVSRGYAGETEAPAKHATLTLTKASQPKLLTNAPLIYPRRSKTNHKKRHPKVPCQTAN